MVSEGTGINLIRSLSLLLPWLVKLLIADLLLTLMLPLKFILPRHVHRVNSAIAGYVWSCIQAIFVISNKADIRITYGHRANGESADSKIPYGSAVVIANHVGWADFYFIQEVAQRSGMLGYCRWFAKRELRWVPFLGWGLWALGVPLVSRNWSRDREELENVFSGIMRGRLPIWLISYSEGTRYTSGKLAASQAWCAANSKYQPQNTLWPRVRGFAATVSALCGHPVAADGATGRVGQASHVRQVIDFTIAYVHNGRYSLSPPTFWQTLSTPDLKAAGWQFHVLVDNFAIEELVSAPSANSSLNSDPELASWIEQRWIVKDQRLERLKWQLEIGTADDVGDEDVWGLKQD